MNLANFRKSILKHHLKSFFVYASQNSLLKLSRLLIESNRVLAFAAQTKPWTVQLLHRPSCHKVCQEPLNLNLTLHLTRAMFTVTVLKQNCSASASAKVFPYGPDTFHFFSQFVGFRLVHCKIKKVQLTWFLMESSWTEVRKKLFLQHLNDKM